MRRIKVKICGLKRVADVEMCMQQGVDILGFVVDYPLSVPWNLSGTEARPLLKLVRSPYRSCMVTGGSPEKVIELASVLRPSMVQLHYRETLQDSIKIANALRELNIDLIKTVPPDAEERIFQFGAADIETIVTELCRTSVSALLADSRSPANAADKSTRLNLDFCTQIIRGSSKPVIIAGGINAHNVSEIVARTNTRWVDIMSGVENHPGEKDAELLAALLSALE